MILLLIVAGLLCKPVWAEPGPPTPDPDRAALERGERELDRQVSATNRCRTRLGLPVFPVPTREWRGDRWDHRRLTIWRARRRAACEIVRSVSSRHHGVPVKVAFAITVVFGAYADEAIAVSRCESRWSVWARNGQYENLFQMGYSERMRYGWHTVGSPPIVAAKAAWRYFDASGRDWSPWACRPDGSVAF